MSPWCEDLPQIPDQHPLRYVAAGWYRPQAGRHWYGRMNIRLPKHWGYYPMNNNGIMVYNFISPTNGILWSISSIIYIYIHISISISMGFVQKCAIPPNSWPSYGAKNYQYDGSPWVIGSWGHLAHLFQSRHRGETDETLDGCSVSLYRWMVYVMENQPTKMGWWLGLPPWQPKKKCVCMVYHQPSRLLLICSSSLLNAAGVHVLGSHLWSQGNVLKCNGWYPLVI